MITKTFEVRDAMTFIVILATKLDPWCEADRYLLSRAGFGLSATAQRNYVLVCKLEGECACGHTDPYGWHDSPRTMRVVQQYLNEHYDELNSGELIDVEFILGETCIRKNPEAFCYEQVDPLSYWQLMAERAKETKG